VKKNHWFLSFSSYTTASLTRQRGGQNKGGGAGADLLPGGLGNLYRGEKIREKKRQAATYFVWVVLANERKRRPDGKKRKIDGVLSYYYRMKGGKGEVEEKKERGIKWRRSTSSSPRVANKREEKGKSFQGGEW